MILKGEDKKKAYSKDDPEDCTLEELITFLCTPDGRGETFKLRCIKVLLSYNEQYAEMYYNQVKEELAKRGITYEW